MATGGDVLTMLCPNVEWLLAGDNYEDINWFDKEPAITKEEFKNGFEKWDIAEKERIAQILENRQQAINKLANLGLNLDEIKSLGLA